MKLHISLASATILVLFLSACGDKTPNCSDNRSKSLVEKIVKDKLKNSSVYFWSEHSSGGNVTLDNIRTNEHNEKVDYYICEANLKLTQSEDYISSYINGLYEESIKNMEIERSNKKLEMEKGIQELNAEMEKVTIINQENKIKEKEDLETYLYELKSELENKNKEWQKSHDRSLSEFEARKKSFISSGGVMDENAKRTFELDKEFIMETLRNKKEGFTNQLNENLERTNNNLINLDNKYSESLKMELSFMQKRKLDLENIYNNLDNEFEKRKKESETYFSGQKTNLLKGLNIPLVYKIQKTDDGKGIHIKVD